MSLEPQLMIEQAFKAFQARDWIRAEEMLKQFMGMIPNNFDAMHLLAIVYASQYKHLDAIRWYEEALKLNPSHSSALSNWGSSLSAIGQNEKALAALLRALEAAPDSPEFLYNAANALCDLTRYDEALIFYEKAVKLNPEYFQAHNNYGKALFDLRRYQDALNCFDRALDINQYFIDSLINKGEALKELKRYYEAIAVIDKAISVNPEYAEAHSNKGNVLNELKRHDEAIAYFEKALSINPEYAEAHSNKGNVLNELKRHDEAIACFEKALSINPNLDRIFGNLLHTKMKICSWSDFGGSLRNIANKALDHKMVSNPFPLLALIDDPLFHKQSSEICVRDKYPFNPALGCISKSSKREKIRIGYYSADFHNHATGYLMAELFELHDKNKFELFAFAFGPKQNDEIRQRLEKSFDQFIEVEQLSDFEIAQLSRDLNIDIAVDLKGFTQDSRTGIFSYRAAPIQVNYLGYPGTMGAEYIDYIIADEIIIPAKSQGLYTEKVVCLPHSYQVNDRERVISTKVFERLDLGLPQDAFVFCCFNNNYKILPKTFEGWMRILGAVDGSVLWLYEDNCFAADNLRKAAEKLGIDSSRLVFAKRMPLQDHLSRHRQADIFLDTSPYNAHTTASDALWCGLPVLTLMGTSFASRVAASLLNAIDLSDLIATSQQEYESIAIELAKEPQKLKTIKLRLATNRLSSPLFDTPLFTKNIESAYTQMMERNLMNLEPAHISIK